MAPTRTQERSRLGSRVVVVGLGLCLGSWATGAAFAGPVASRREAAAAGMIAVLGGMAPAAYGEFRPGTASEPGVNEEAFDYDAKDSEELVGKRKAARDAAKAREAEETKKFRAIFSEFASDNVEATKRASLLDAMKAQVIEDRRLPLEITRDDVVKGVRAVKYNIGCIKDKPKKDQDCKVIEKSYMKLLAGIDKVSDRSLLSR